MIKEIKEFPMNTPLTTLPLFFLSLIFGIAMLTEGFLIVKLHRQIIPLPSRVLAWISVGRLGKGQNTPANLRTYALFVLVFGTTLVVASFVYLISG
jgi:hypothetical protein